LGLVIRITLPQELKVATPSPKRADEQKSEAQSGGFREELAEVLAPFRGDRSSLIPALQAVQEKLGYLPQEAFGEIAEALHLSQSEVFGVVTFYSQFRLTRGGAHTVTVCSGTACHVRGGERVLRAAQTELGIDPGDITEDYKFGLERVACFGSCALGPVVVVDKQVYGRMSPAKMKQVISQYE
jgi:NADH:ubiquinone oxidoreductase subunit E